MQIPFLLKHLHLEQKVSFSFSINGALLERSTTNTHFLENEHHLKFSITEHILIISP